MPEKTASTLPSLVIPNNIVFNNLIDAVRAGKSAEKKLRVTPAIHVPFRVLNGYCEEFTEYDLAVYSCLCGIWQSSPDHTFTLTRLCRMLGYGQLGGVSKAAVNEVKASLERLSAIQVQLTPYEEFERRRAKFTADLPEGLADAGWDRLTDVSWRDANSLLQLTQNTRVIPRSGTVGNKHETLYTIEAEPLLHLYSRVTGQFVTLDPQYFQICDPEDDTRSLLSSTSTRIAMIFWVARQLKRIEYSWKHPGKKQQRKTDVLRLRTIFDRAGLSQRNASRHKKRHVDFLQTMLASWSADGLISCAWSYRPGIWSALEFTPALEVASSQTSAPDIASPLTAAVSAIRRAAAPLQEVASALTASSETSKPDTIIGALDTIFGALDTIIGAVASWTSATKPHGSGAPGSASAESSPICTVSTSTCSAPSSFGGGGAVILPV